MLSRAPPVTSTALEPPPRLSTFLRQRAEASPQFRAIKFSRVIGREKFIVSVCTLVGGSAGKSSSKPDAAVDMEKAPLRRRAKA